MAAEVRVVGGDELQRALRELAEESPAMVARAIRAGAAQLGEGMERRAPELSDEARGTIGESIEMKPAGRLSVIVGTDHPMATVVEEGGEITPTRSRILASEEQDAVFGRRVIMPARPFVRPAFDEDLGAVSNAMERSAKRSLARRRRG